MSDGGFLRRRLSKGIYRVSAMAKSLLFFFFFFFFKILTMPAKLYHGGKQIIGTVLFGHHASD